ncbi:DUF3299 domain-containing protein [Alteromonas sp. KUL49]|uniref:DUF3299 domain-containing protein n=2 Tax=Alteromonas sp. KUL49 TaxID=2480798 RepID=UPI00102F11A5|nr:DUF3299 domain-containing protein [Alteromonas sp. KUL49]TAP39300.1 DUF3299 domain-containing protein [Alteromonas sp. KUL49]GEA12087.1 hypothetical protein KUL49_24620 [Alteromonas sp. KUL49]
MQRIKNSITTGFLAFFLFFHTGVMSDDAAVEVYWEDLVPEGFNELTAPLMQHDSQMTQLQPNAPVVEKYDGMRVKVPGFVVPLEGDADKITEFLLVPFFGACVHVPPPPSNQIVHVTFEEGISIDNLYDAIWVTGEMSTEGWKGDIASVGYRLSGEAVEAF